jgi:hypothetical protein
MDARTQKPYSPILYTYLDIRALYMARLRHSTFQKSKCLHPSIMHSLIHVEVGGES